MKKNHCFAITQQQSNPRKLTGSWLLSLLWLLLLTVPAAAQTKRSPEKSLMSITNPSKVLASA